MVYQMRRPSMGSLLTILKVRLHLHGPAFLGYVWSRPEEYHYYVRSL